MNLLKNVNIVYLSSEAAQKASRVSHHLDMANFEGALFLGIGTSGCVSATGIVMTVQGCSSTTLASFSTYLGSTKVVGGGTYSAQGLGNRIIAVDLYKPLKRYARFTVQRSSMGQMPLIAIQYNPKRPGSTEVLDSVCPGAANSGTGTVVASTLLVSPTS